MVAGKQNMKEAALLFHFLRQQKQLHVHWLFKKRCRMRMQIHFDFRIAINAGEPVEKSNQLFGDTIQFADNMCFIARKFSNRYCIIGKRTGSKRFFSK